MKPVVLIVDDEQATCYGFSQYLENAGYRVHTAGTLAEGADVAEREPLDVILLDLNLPDGNGCSWIPVIREKYPLTAVVVITGTGDINNAVEAMRLGADNLMTKPVDLPRLDVYLRKSLDLKRLRRAGAALERSAAGDGPWFGSCGPVQRVMKLARVAAGNDAVVLLNGETGTGKGVLARWIHDHGGRADGEFVEVNCSGLRGEMLASELFGHVKGAFTSAVGDKVGLVEFADRGTLFLDEIGDMGTEVQAQLLKTIEDKRFRRLGDVKPRSSDFRLICATHRDLRCRVAEGGFREDLYFRINVFPVELPPLRDLGPDLPGLVRHLLDDLGGRDVAVSAGVMDVLAGYEWPGNVRELRNVLERALLLADGGVIKTGDLPGLRGIPGREAESSSTRLDDVEITHIKNILGACGNDTLKASDMLGISRAALYRKLKKFGIG